MQAFCKALCEQARCFAHDPHKLQVCVQEYYTSGFLSLQAAIDAYALGLGLPAAMDTSLALTPAGNGSELAGAGAAAPSAGGTARHKGGPGAPGSAAVTAWTQWGAVMPTSAYTHNDFYVRTHCHEFSIPCAMLMNLNGRRELWQTFELWRAGLKIALNSLVNVHTP